MILCFMGAVLFASCGGNAPEKLEVSSFPDTLTVVQGEAPDFSGGTVKVSYQNGDSKDVPMAELEVRGFKAETLGDQTVVLVYSEKGKSVSTTLNMKVVLPAVTRLELSLEGVKTDYLEGDAFSRENLVVTAHYSTGASEEISVYEVYPAKLTSDTTKVRISYRGARAEIAVTVLKKTAASLVVISPPAKTHYFTGEAFSAEGLTAKVIYNDGKEDLLDASHLRYAHLDGSEYLFSLNERDNLVILSVITDYGEAQTELRLEVEDVVPVRLTVSATHTPTFLEGDTFAFPKDESVTVLVDYNNGTSDSFIGSEDFFAYAPDPLQAGQRSVEIWQEGYEEVKAALPIEVSPAEVTSIAVLSAPTKLFYQEGEKVDLTGLILLVFKSNGSSAALDYAEDIGITATPDLVGEDTETITVTYAGESVSFTIDR